MKIRPLSRFFLLDLWGSLKGRLISLILKHTCFPLCGLGEPAARWQVAPEYGASGTGVGKPPPPYPGGGREPSPTSTAPHAPGEGQSPQHPCLLVSGCFSSWVEQMEPFWGLRPLGGNKGFRILTRRSFPWRPWINPVHLLSEELARALY